jgi:sterol desaturase/sphingolipid hydroxylase (fatty acid hydroxylase superfamily)
VPTLFQLFSDPVTWAFFGVFGAIWTLEAAFPARALPRITGHRRRGVVALVVFFLVSSYLPYWVAPWVAPLCLADLTGLGTWGGALVATLVYQLIGYAYHRSLHASDWLFRVVHQGHHSSERLDAPSAFWFSPLDMIGWTSVSILAVSLIGVTPGAVVVFALFAAFLGTFQHANLKTPRWLGYLIQRPESHSHHHARGVHRDNYADLPVFDLLFGSFVNPPGFAEQTGFYDGASSRVADLLLGRDVTQPDGRQLTFAESAAQGAEAAAVESGR